MLHYAAAEFSVQLLPGLAAQFFAHVNCLKNMSKNLSFVKNQLIAQFLQPKKMSKNLSSGFTAFKISQVRYRTQSVSRRSALSQPARVFLQISLLAVKAALRHILTNANGLDCRRLICFGCSGRLRSVSITGEIICIHGLPAARKKFFRPTATFPSSHLYK